MQFAGRTALGKFRPVHFRCRGKARRLGVLVAVAAGVKVLPKSEFELWMHRSTFLASPSFKRKKRRKLLKGSTEASSLRSRLHLVRNLDPQQE